MSSLRTFRKHGDLVVYPIAKCASESLSYGDRVDPQPAVVFIRDPIERAISGFQFFLPHPKDDRYAPTWEAYVDRILDGIVDMHWEPQAELIARVEVSRFVPFEHLPKLLPNLEWRHKSRPVEVDRSYRIDELQKFYSKDYELRAYMSSNVGWGRMHIYKHGA